MIYLPDNNESINENDLVSFKVVTVSQLDRYLRKELGLKSKDHNQEKLICLVMKSHRQPDIIDFIFGGQKTYRLYERYDEKLLKKLQKL